MMTENEERISSFTYGEGEIREVTLKLMIDATLFPSNDMLRVWLKAALEIDLDAVILQNHITIRKID